MPNGSPYTIDEYRTLDSFIAPVDLVVRQYGETIGARLDIGYHGMPDRKLFLAASDDLQRVIDVSPRFLGADGLTPTCLVTTFAWKDYGSLPDVPPKPGWMSQLQRRLWHSEIARLAELPTAPQDFLSILIAAHDALNGISERDLVLVG